MEKVYFSCHRILGAFIWKDNTIADVCWKVWSASCHHSIYLYYLKSMRLISCVLNRILTQSTHIWGTRSGATVLKCIPRVKFTKYTSTFINLTTPRNGIYVRYFLEYQFTISLDEIVCHQMKIRINMTK